jgi:hypothetical protein
MASDLMELVGNITNSAVRKVEFRTQVTPDYVYDPRAPSQPAPPGNGLSTLVMKFLKPTVVVDTVAGPVVVAPYGTAQNNYFVPLLVGAGILVVGLVAGIGWIARKI